MKSKAYIRLNDKTLLVRFEGVGRKGHFDKILNRWRSEFPQAEWNNTYQAWELPVANFEDVKLFCDKMFGKVLIESLVLSIKQGSQLKLNF